MTIPGRCPFATSGTFATIRFRFSVVRLVELIATHARIPLKRRIRHASHTRTDNDSLLVTARLDDGTTGWGKGCHGSMSPVKRSRRRGIIFSPLISPGRWGAGLSRCPS